MMDNIIRACKQLVSQYSCDICRRTFTSLSSLNLHSQTYPNLHFTYPCCGAQYLWLNGNLWHTCKSCVEIEPENAIACDTDLKKFSFSDASSEYADGSVFRCDNCTKVYSQYKTLKTHILKFPAKHDFACQRCGKYFLTDEKLRKHLCLLIDGSFQCSCKAYFKSLDKFKEHIGHSRPYFCCVCNHKSVTFNNLVNHIRSHTKENPFSCEICKRKFRVRESLTAHMKLHNGQKLFQCSKCIYRTFRKWNLTLHEKRHNPRNLLKKFLCAECGSSFYMKHHLRRHATVHNKSLLPQSELSDKHLKKDKKYYEIGQKCGVCEVQLRRGQLYQHYMETGHFQHVCHPCQTVFVTKFNLQRHLKNHNKPD